MRYPARFQLRAGRQPVPVRPGARPRLRLPVARAPPLPGPAVRPAARPGRPAGPDVPGHRARRRAAATRRAPPPCGRGCWRPGRRPPQRWAGQGWRTNAEVPGPVLRTRFALPRSAVRPLDAGLRAGRAHRPRRRPRAAGGLDAGRPRRPRPTRPRSWSRPRCSSATGGRHERRDRCRRRRGRRAADRVGRRSGRAAVCWPGRTCRGWPSRRRRRWPAGGRGRAGRGGRAGASTGGCRRAGRGRDERPPGRRTGPSADLDAAAAAGARLLTPEHPEWPELAVRRVRRRRASRARPAAGAVGARPGRLDELCEHAVAVVGARAATSYGAHVAGELAAGLADRGCTVVSGAAIGIDGAAHRGALGRRRPHRRGARLRRRPRLPGGARAAARPDRRRAGWWSASTRRAACPARHRFLVRNRLIAGLAAGTVVVEAGLRSGAQRTGADAAALGRPVMAVPGPVTSGNVGGLPPADPRRRRAGHPQPRRCWRRSAPIGVRPRRAGPAPEAGRPTDGLGAGRGARARRAAGPRRPRDPLARAWRPGVPIGAVRVALVDLERRGLVEHRERTLATRGGGQARDDDRSRAYAQRLGAPTREVRSAPTRPDTRRGA